LRGHERIGRGPLDAQNHAEKSARPKTRPSSRAARRLADSKRRIRAAGLLRDDSDPAPEDIDEFRNNLARRIAMLINDWHGCRESLCRRQRGCMAPRITCTNHKPGPPVSPDEHARFMADLQREVRAAIDRKARGEGT
jgi:hypothetical protein